MEAVRLAGVVGGPGERAVGLQGQLHRRTVRRASGPVADVTSGLGRLLVGRSLRLLKLRLLHLGLLNLRLLNLLDLS